MNRVSFRVAGVTFAPGYPDNLARLRQLADERSAHERLEPIPVVLLRNPDNAHDANAIEVHVPGLDAMIGHVPREVARTLAGHLDDGERWQAEVVFVAVDPAHRDRPGIEVAAERVA